MPLEVHCCRGYMTRRGLKQAKQAPRSITFLKDWSKLISIVTIVCLFLTRKTGHAHTQLMPAQVLTSSTIVVIVVNVSL